MYKASLEDMAVPGAMLGRYVCIKKVGRTELDEHLVVGQIGITLDHVVFTTDDDPPHAFQHKVLTLAPGPLQNGGYRIMTSIAADRVPPPGAPAWQVNNVWMDGAATRSGGN